VPEWHEQLPRDFIVLVLAAWKGGNITEGKAAALLGTDLYSLNAYAMAQGRQTDLPDNIWG
jgi:hypothetical protein